MLAYKTSADRYGYFGIAPPRHEPGKRRCQNAVSVGFVCIYAFILIFVILSSCEKKFNPYGSEIFISFLKNIASSLCIRIIHMYTFILALLQPSYCRVLSGTARRPSHPAAAKIPANTSIR